MSDINQVTIVGRLTRDPELRQTQGGTSYAKFSLACGRTYKVGDDKKEETSFLNCVAWGRPGEVIAQYCKKGKRLGVTGRLQQQSWTDSDGNKRQSVDIVVEGFQFLDPQGERGGGGQQQQRQSSPPSQASEPYGSDDDDIPF